MGASSSTCRGLMQGTLALFVLIFLVAVFIAIVDWSASATCMFNRCTRILMDVVMVVLAISGLLYAGYLLSRCRCEGSCGTTNCREEKTEIADD